MGTLKKIKRLLANRGGIGASLSRAESIERLNPLVRRHMKVNYTYDAAIERHSQDEVTSALRTHQKTARADVGKLRETILSMGGVADNGVDLEPADFASDRSGHALIDDLQDREQKLLDAVQGELDLDLPEHQWRTIAILENVRDHSKDRLNYLQELTRKNRRSSSIPAEAQQKESDASADGPAPSPKEQQAEAISDSTDKGGEMQSETDSGTLGKEMDTTEANIEPDDAARDDKSNETKKHEA